MTKQEVFDKSVTGLASQNFEKSMYSKDDCILQCAYNSPDGKHCAMGWVFDFKPEHEGSGISALRRKHPDMIPDIDDTNIDSDDFYHYLQRCHDDIENSQQMVTRLTEFAKKYNLIIPDVMKNHQLCAEIDFSEF